MTLRLKLEIWYYSLNLLFKYLNEKEWIINKMPCHVTSWLTCFSVIQIRISYSVAPDCCRVDRRETETWWSTVYGTGCIKNQRHYMDRAMTKRGSVRRQPAASYCTSSAQDEWSNYVSYALAQTGNQSSQFVPWITAKILEYCWPSAGELAGASSPVEETGAIFVG